MNPEDLKLLMDWFEENKDHKLNFIEKEGIKLAVRKAETVGDLLKSDTKLDEMRESCRRFVHKDSCRRIYELAKNLVENKE